MPMKISFDHIPLVTESGRTSDPDRVVDADDGI